jgi:hypothetical protein
MDMLPDLIAKMNAPVLNAMAEIQQPRSKFQIEKFVINQHATKEMQYFQCVTEIQALYYTIKSVSLDMKITELKIKKLKTTGDEIDNLEAQKLELGLEQTRLVGVGAFRELDILLEIFNSFEKQYTRAEIDNNQSDYWNKRLTRQATLEAIGGTQAQAAHLDSLRQIGAIEMTSEGGIRAVTQEMQQMTGQNQKELS